jgi:hypothetical protein
MTYDVDPSRPYPHCFEITPGYHRDMWVWCHKTFGHDRRNPKWVHGLTAFKFKEAEDAMRFWMRFGSDEV